MKKIKGFIGPIGDDLPSLIAVMLALTIFFSGLTFAMRTFNRKQRDVRLLQGGLDISRSIIQDPIIDIEGDMGNPVDKSEARTIAENNDLAFNADYGSGDITGEPFPDVETYDEIDDNCGEESLYFSYLISVEEDDDIELETIRICVWDIQ